MFPAQIKSGCMSSQWKPQFWRASLDEMNVGQGYVDGAVSERTASGCPDILLAAEPGVVTAATSLPSSAGVELSILTGKHWVAPGRARQLPPARSTPGPQLCVSRHECVSFPPACLALQLRASWWPLKPTLCVLCWAALFWCLVPVCPPSAEIHLLRPSESDLPLGIHPCLSAHWVSGSYFFCL